MSDFAVTVGGDFSELLRGFKQLEQQARQAGDSVGKGIAEGIQGYSTKSLTALQAELARLQSRQTRVAVDSSAFEKTGERIRQVQALITEVERRRLSIGVDDRSITALQSKLGALQQKQVTLDVDSSEFAAATREIAKVQQQISEVEKKRLLINADPRSVTALNARLGDLREELNRVAIGSQRFKELQAAIQSTERELQQAGQAADGFNLIDGAIQGLAFSLTNTVTNAAGSALRAIGGLINGFAELDTEIRQAAAAAGEPGGYDKIARSIDQVGIEAAGTQQQVAQLATELIRGGMTVDQMNASLGAIVRGAEATGTGFAQMGSVVSASLKGFGLQATDAKRVVDALVQGANASASSVDGMGMAFKYAAPVARILGVSVEELGIAVGLLTNAGIDASEAGVTLRNGLSKLASAAPATGGAVQKLSGQAKMAADTMKQLGINIYNADGTLQPMETTLLKLKGAFEKLDPASKIRLAANLFGGEDDGTKWLALLNQSEEEIRKMSATMANTKGATDKARDAMQGFQMGMNQLTGTLDSLGKSLGSVAAAALTPFVNLLNLAVGAVAGLPTPVKTAGAALILLAGAATTATAAVAIFQRAMTVTAIQTAVQQIGLLAVEFGQTFKAGITAATVALRAHAAALGAFAAAAVGVMAVMKSYNIATADSQRIAEAAADGQTKLADALDKAGVKTRELTTLGGPLARAWQNNSVVLDTTGSSLRFVGEMLGGVVKQLPGFQLAAPALKALAKALDDLIKKVKEAWANANATQGLENATVALSNLDSQAVAAGNAAMKLYAELKNLGKPLDTKQTEQVQALGNALVASKDKAKALQKQFTDLAAAARKSGNKEMAQDYERLAKAAAQGIPLYDIQIQKLNSLLPANKQITNATNEQTQAIDARRKAQAELNKIISEAPILKVDNQLAVGQQLLGLARALGDAEQSRFNIAKSALQFELQKLEERGAGEAVIAAKKAEIDRVDRAALSARYQALIQQQALEQAMLTLTQEKARMEANVDVQRQRVEVLKTTKELMDAMNKNDQEAVKQLLPQVALQEEILKQKQGVFNLLGQTQPLERAIAAATGETARNNLQSEARMKGYTFAADGSLVKTQGIAGSLEKVSALSGASAEQQARFRDIAAQSGLAIGKAADGTLVLGRTQADVNRAVADMNLELGKAKGGYDGTAKAASGTRTETDRVRQALINAGTPAKEIERLLGESAGKAQGAKDATNGLRGSLANAKGPAGDIASAFVSTGKNAPAAAQGARDFAGWLSGARGFAKQIADLNLGGRMVAVRDATRGAADQAKRFYDWLKQASDLPGSRWSGGPVEAGAEYRVNELGQEALLSAGRLSLINAPQNAIWRAPSNGVVVPAGITARLQEAGALPSTGGFAAPAGTAELAVEIGKLRQEVGELARRQWNINVTQRTGPTGSQVLRTLQQLR